MTYAKLRLALAAMGKHETKASDLRKEIGVIRQTLYRYIAPEKILTGFMFCFVRRPPF